MSRSKQRQRLAASLTPSKISSEGSKNDDSASQDGEGRPHRSLFPLDPSLTAAGVSKLLLSLLRDKLYDYILGRVIDKACEKFSLTDILRSSPINGSPPERPTTTPPKLAEIQKEVVENMKILSTFMTLCITTPQVFNSLPAPETFPNGCENTWLMKILLFPSYVESQNGSSKENAEPDTEKHTRVGPCAFTFAEAEGAVHDSPDVYFQMSFKFTLWDEAANAPVLYYTASTLTNPAIERSPASALKTVDIGASIDFRIPAKMLQNQGLCHDTCNTKQTSGMVTAPCVGQLAPDFCDPSDPYINIEECSSACNTFFNELLLAINLVIPELWCSGPSSTSFLTKLCNNSPAQQLNASDKGKSRSPITEFDYGNCACIPDLPDPGQFRPAKVLCHDRMMSMLIPHCMALFRINLAEYACGRPLFWQDALCDSLKVNEIQQDVSSSGIGRETYTLQDRKPGFYTDFQKKGGGKKGSVHAKGGDKTSLASATSPDPNAAGVKYDTVPLNKSSYAKQPHISTPPQMLLICNCCGIFGVDRDGVLPWPKLSRCSRCKTAWYCSLQCQKDDWVVEHKKLCMLDDGTGGGGSSSSSSRGREDVRERAGK